MAAASLQLLKALTPFLPLQIPLLTDKKDPLPVVIPSIAGASPCPEAPPFKQLAIPARG